MKKLLLILALALPLAAQMEQVQRVLPIRHANPNDLMPLLAPFASALKWHVSDGMRVVSVSGPKDAVDAFEAALGKLDVPRQSMELTCYLLLAAPQGEMGPIPSDLTGVVKQLQSVFGFKSFRVLETALLRGVERKGVSSSGMMASPFSGPDGPLKGEYQLQVRNVTFGGADKQRRIRLDGLRLVQRFETSKGQWQTLDLQTDVELTEGQKIVVGKTSVDTSNQSVFLVVTGRIAD
jgi:hypothetical protein